MSVDLVYKYSKLKIDLGTFLILLRSENWQKSLKTLLNWELKKSNTLLHTCQTKLCHGHDDDIKKTI